MKIRKKFRLSFYRAFLIPIKRLLLYRFCKLLGLKMHFFVVEQEEQPDGYKFYLSRFDSIEDFTFSMNINDTKFYDNLFGAMLAYREIRRFAFKKLLECYCKFIRKHRTMSFKYFKKINKYGSKYYIDFYVFFKPQRKDIGKTHDN